MEELEEAAGEVTGQVTAGNSLSTEVAAPWNTSITIPPVQITHFQHRAPLGLSNSNFEIYYI